MKTIKILDVYNHTEDNVEFGTCELCFYTGSLTTEFIKVEYDSKIYDLEMGGWSWGDYIPYTVPDINNIIKFNDFSMTQPVDINLSKYNPENDIIQVLISIMEYYDKFYQSQTAGIDWGELLTRRLNKFTEHNLISMGNFKPQDKLDDIIYFLQHHEYYDLNNFIDIYVCSEFELDNNIHISEEDQQWSFKEMLKIIEKYKTLMEDY